MSDTITLAPQPRAAAIRARHAASLVVLQDGAMLMGMRGAGHRFMPNALGLSRRRRGPGGRERPPSAGRCRSTCWACLPNPASRAWRTP